MSSQGHTTDPNVPAESTKFTKDEILTLAESVSRKLDFRRWIGTCSLPSTSRERKTQIRDQIQQTVKQALIAEDEDTERATAVSSIYPALAATLGGVSATAYLMELATTRVERSSDSRTLDTLLAAELGALRTCMEYVGIEDFGSRLEDYLNIVGKFLQAEQNSSEGVQRPIGPWETKEFFAEAVLGGWVDAGEICKSDRPVVVDGDQRTAVIASLLRGDPGYSSIVTRSDFDGLLSQKSGYGRYIEWFQKGDSDGEDDMSEEGEDDEGDGVYSTTTRRPVVMTIR